MRGRMTEDLLAGLLRHVSLFASVQASDLLAVAKAARLLSKRKTARIFEEGSPADSCFVVTSGRAKVVLSGQAGTEIIIGTVEPFELVGELALLDNSPRSAGLVAMEDCHLIVLPAASFKALRNNRAFEDKLVSHVASMLRRATEQLRAIHTYSSAERVSWCLARIASRSGRSTGGAIVIARPTHHELAEMTGCSRETVTRVLLQLKRLKWIAWDAELLRINESAFKRYLDIERAATAGADISRVV